MIRPDDGQAFTLWRATAPKWRAYTRHAFVEGLAEMQAESATLGTAFWQMGLEGA